MMILRKVLQCKTHLRWLACLTVQGFLPVWLLRDVYFQSSSHGIARCNKRLSRLYPTHVHDGWVLRSVIINDFPGIKFLDSLNFLDMGKNADVPLILKK